MDPDRPAQRLDPVGQADEPGASPEGSPADAVVADREVEQAVACLGLDLSHRRLGVLGRVGECLGDDVVRGHLDRLGQPSPDVDLQLDRDGGAAGQGLERRPKPALGQDGWMDAARQLLELGQCLPQPVRDPLQLPAQLGVGGRGGRLGGA